MKYDITVTRDGRWWMIEVPAIDGLTQARRISEIEEMARSLIAVTLDVPQSHVELGETHITVPGLGDVTDYPRDIAAARAEAEAAEAKAAKELQEKAHALVDADVPLRDAATMLGVSYQRVHQLAHA